MENKEHDDNFPIGNPCIYKLNNRVCQAGAIRCKYYDVLCAQKEASKRMYNGHRSWNAWNVALWMGNDESLYRFAMECLKGINSNKRGIAWATRLFMRQMGGEKTPDGAKYNALCVREALTGFIEG